MKKKFIFFAVVLLMFSVSCDDYMEDLLFQSKLTEGLVAYWPITESYTSSTSYGKTIKDHSGNGNDITLWANGGAGTPSVNLVPGVYSTALSFDGSNDYAQLTRTNLNLLKGSNELTIAFWYNPLMNGMGTNVIKCNAFYLDIDGTYLGFYNPTDNVWINSIIINQWCFITITYDKKNLILYVNGIKKDESASQVDLLLFNDLYLGQNGSNGGFYYGSIDEIRIYNRALKQDEIEAIMDIGVD